MLALHVKVFRLKTSVWIITSTKKTWFAWATLYISLVCRAAPHQALKSLWKSLWPTKRSLTTVWLVQCLFMQARSITPQHLSVFAENDAMKMTADKLGNEAWGAMTRLVWRPTTEHGKIFHVGVSGAYESPRYNKNAAHPFTFSLFHLFTLPPFHLFTFSLFHLFTFSL